MRGGEGGVEVEPPTSRRGAATGGGGTRRDATVTSCGGTPAATGGQGMETLVGGGLGETSGPSQSILNFPDDDVGFLVQGFDESKERVQGRQF